MPIYEDVRNVTKEKLEADGITGIDVITGGYPCQDLSVAGKQEGINAERSGLWSECARLLGEIRPRYAIFENVTALISGDNGRWFQRVLWDISQVGYDAEWHCIPASELGAHHHRDRVWVICYPSIMQCNGSNDNGKDSKCKISEPGNTSGKNDVAYAKCGIGQVGRIDARIRRIKELDKEVPGTIWKTEPIMDRVVNGLPKGMDRLKGLGNAVVPQIPELIGRAIIDSMGNIE